MKLQRATTLSLLSLLSLTASTTINSASACPGLTHALGMQCKPVARMAYLSQLEPHSSQVSGPACKFHHDGADCKDPNHKAVQIDLKAASVYCQSGDKKVASHDFKGAIEDYTLATRLNPTFGRIYAPAADNFLVGCNLEQLVSDYNQVLLADTNNAEAFALRGEMKYNLGDAEGAEADFRKAIECNSNLYFAHLRLTETNIFLQPQNIRTSDCHEALLLFPHDPRLHLNTGIALGRVGYFKQAATEYGLANELSPQWSRPFYMMSFAELATGNRQSALSDLDKCIKYEPSWAWAYIARAELETEAYNNKAAISDLDHAIALKPNASWLVSYRARLKLSSGDIFGGVFDFIGIASQRSEFHLLLAAWFILAQLRLVGVGSETIRRRLLMHE